MNNSQPITVNSHSGTKFNKYVYVQLDIQPGQSNVPFTPQQYLQNRQIFSVEVFNSGDINESRSNTAIVTPAMMAGITLTFFCTDVNLPVQAIPGSAQFTGQGWGFWFRDVPTARMHSISSGTNSYARDLFQMYGEFIDFEQSYANISPISQALINTAGVTQSLILGCAYK